MTSAISNLGLLDRCKEYILTDDKRTDMDGLIKNALISSNREISELGSMPLAWNREVYDELFTRYYATISAITSASPGVITADSVDPDLSDDHGFQTNDIIYLDGVNGENSRHRLNNRLFRAVRASATTLTLKTLDGQTAVSTASYDDYDSGGTIYHAGTILSITEPSGGNAYYEWDLKRVFDVQFDLFPSDPVSEAEGDRLCQPGSRPQKWRYQQYAYAGFASPVHILFWYNFPSVRYNVRVHFEKEYPDLGTWTASVYPPHPDHIHDYIWHRALANLAMHTEKQRRRGRDGMDNTKIEILNAQFWINQRAEDELKILEYSNKLLGHIPYMSKGMSA